MAEDARRGAGTNSRPLNDTISGTAPGIPDDSLQPGQEPPTPDDDAELERARSSLDRIGSPASKP